MRRQPESPVRHCLKLAGKAGLGVLGGGLLALAAAPAAEAAQGAAPDLTPVGQLPLYPMAGSPVDPLSHSAATNVAGVPVSSAPVNDVFADGLRMNDLPVAGAAFTGPQGAQGGAR